MPKKQPKNAYYFFMLDFKRCQEAAGRRFPGGLKDVADAASDPWKAISAREKERYEQMAKAHKAQDKKHGERYTSQGKPLSELKKEKEEKEQKVEDQKRAVVKLIDDAVRNDNLDLNPFYIISCNYFTKEQTKARYYPAELGIVRFSIKKGITKKYHSLINPGPLPLGHAYTSKEHSEKTHKLPLPPKAYGESEYDLVLGQMIELFVEERSAVEETFPVLVMENEMEMTETILREFCEKGELEYDTIRLLPLTFFFHKLRVAVDKVFLEIESQFSYAIAQAHLERDNYQYYAGHGCKLHEVDDVNIHCALSRPTRWAYYIIDQTIGITGGKKSPGYHFPKGCVIDGDGDADSDDAEDVKLSLKNGKANEEDDEHFTEASDLKVEKNEFSDDESTTIDHKRDYRPSNGRNYREGYTISTVSSRSDSPRRPKEEGRHHRNDRRYYNDETDSTISSRHDTRYKAEIRDRHGRRGRDSTDRSYASSVGLSNTQRSTNPFHKDNFPPLGAGAIPKTSGNHSRTHESYRRIDGDSDSDKFSDRRSNHKDCIDHKERYHKERKDSLRSVGSCRSGSSESRITDPRLPVGESAFGSEQYLREKYEKLKAELALLEQASKKRDLSRSRENDHLSRSKRSRTTRSRSRDKFAENRSRNHHDDRDVFHY